MRLLADENCDRLLVAMLRDAGHDVAYALERWRGADDVTLNRIAREQNRVVLTDDLDFGELALNRNEMDPAIVLIRLHPLPRMVRLSCVVSSIGELGDEPRGQLIILEPGQIRIRQFGVQT